MSARIAILAAFNGEWSSARVVGHARTRLGLERATRLYCGAGWGIRLQASPAALSSLGLYETVSGDWTFGGAQAWRRAS